MSWKFVFNNNLAGYKIASDAREAAKKSGYKFYTYGDKVRFIYSDEDTGLTINDLF